MLSEFEISPMPDGTGLKLVGELDLMTTPELSRALFDLSPHDISTLDLSELRFVDSSGVQAILTLAKSVNGNGPLVLLNPTEAVSRVLEILGLDEHVDIRVARVGASPPG